MNPTHTIIFFINYEKKEIYLVLKEVPHKPHLKHLHLKLNGFGGGIEEFDSNEYKGLRREIQEELELDLNQFEVEKIGTFITNKGVVATFIGKVNSSNLHLLKVGRIDGEGDAKWYSFDEVLNNPNLLPNGYLPLYQHLFENKKNFMLDFRN